MMRPRNCPYCQVAALRGCAHLALAVEGRLFVRRCVESCHGERQWQLACQKRRGRAASEWSPNNDDFTWLETAFCDEFLKHLRWFGGIEYEWRMGPKPGQGGFWVLLWSKDPQKLWWELRDELDRQAVDNALEPSKRRA